MTSSKYLARFVYPSQCKIYITLSRNIVEIVVLSLARLRQVYAVWMQIAAISHISQKAGVGQKNLKNWYWCNFEKVRMVLKQKLPYTVLPTFYSPYAFCCWVTVQIYQFKYRNIFFIMKQIVVLKVVLYETDGVSSTISLF